MGDLVENGVATSSSVWEDAISMLAAAIHDNGTAAAIDISPPDALSLAA